MAFARKAYAYGGALPEDIHPADIHSADIPVDIQPGNVQIAA
jgi:hypothetical protein